MFEKAKWISKYYGASSIIEPAPLFEKVFNIDKSIKKAVMYVCALGYGEYSINGKKIHNDVLTTPYTNYLKTVLYNKYDITHFVKRGKNTVEILIGNGPYHVAEKNSWKDFALGWFSNPKFIMQIEICCSDGEIKNVYSDTEFKWCDSGIIYNEWKMGEVHDKRHIDKKWNNATISFPPGGILKENYIPPIIIDKQLPMKKIAENIYDCGQNMSGWVHLSLKGIVGQEVKIIYSERFENGDINTKYTSDMTEHTENKHIDKVILSGNDDEFEPKFVYHGFRYVKLFNVPDNVKVTAKFVHTDLKQIGDFKCSNDVLNKLHNMTKWATLSNYHSIPTDCPSREQNGWTADAYLSVNQAMMNFDMFSVYKKFLQDIADCQRLSGQIPCVVPQTVFGYNWGCCFAWDIAFVLIPYEFYNATGNIELIKEFYPAIEKYFDFADKMHNKYIAENGLGDWVPPDEHKNTCSVWIVETACYYKMAQAMIEYCKILGKDERKYTQLAVNIRSAFRKKYFIGGEPTDVTQTALACVLYHGLAEIGEKVTLLKLLVDDIKANDYHHTCGIFGNKYLYTVLSENGQIELLYKLTVNKTFPSYGYWVEQGLTTLAENWNIKKNSLNHHMFSEVDNWFYKYVAGFNYNHGKLTVHPHFVKEIECVDAKCIDASISYDMYKLKITSKTDIEIRLNENIYNLKPGTYTFEIKR